VGIRTALRLASAVSDPAPRLAAPWAPDNTLSSLVWADLFDAESLPIDRAAAMAVPAMARARHLIAGAVAACPLLVVRDEVTLTREQAPAWTYRTDGPVSPFHRMLWTVDDLLFSGWSLWQSVNDSEGFPLTFDRVPRDAWSFGDDGSTVLGPDDRPLPADTHTLIPGPHEGMLSFAARTLRAAGKMERAAARHASNPVPSIELHQEADVEVTPSERDDLLAQWRNARNSEAGAVGWTSYGIRAYPLGQVPEQLLIEGRNAASVDVARHASIPAAMLDATAAGASLTYETTQGRNGQFLDYGVSLYLDAVAARLSQDDVVPRGTRVAFDTSSLTALSRAAVDPGTGE
jgi:hypothetical protein